MNLFSCILVVSLPAIVFGDCGRNYAGNRVVGGSEAPPNSWPWQVSLQVRGQHRCGGSVVAPGWILSAGHCFLRVSQPNQWTVVAGEHDLRRNSGREQVRNVVQIITNPGFRGNFVPGGPFDMVLMKLAQPLQYNAYVQPVCLPPQGISEDLQQRTCMLTGWGRTKGPQDSTKLQQVGGPIISPATCRRVWGNRKIVSQQICFGTGLYGGCQGDSGGPLVCRSQAGQWIQVGVVSWGNTQCKVRGYPTVFTRVSSMANWIQSIIA